MREAAFEFSVCMRKDVTVEHRRVFALQVELHALKSKKRVAL